MTNILAPIFVLGVLIFIHELGHFGLAKILGIRVVRFSLGFPPKMIGKKIGETEYLISWIPLGGYVRMAGDNPEESLSGEKWEFLSRPKWQRSLVIIAGPAMNYLFAFILVWMILLFGGIGTLEPVVDQIGENSLAEQIGLQPEDRIMSVNEIPIQTWDEIYEGLLRERGDRVTVRVQRSGVEQNLEFDLSEISEEQIGDLGITPLFTTAVGEVEMDGPAYQAGIRSGDIIEDVDGTSVKRWSEMVRLIQDKPDSTVAITWRRGERSYQAAIRTRAEKVPDQEGNMRPVGFVGITSRVLYKKIGLIRSAKESARWTWETTEQIVLFIKGLFTGEVSARMVGGPIFIAQVAGQTARQGFTVLLSLMALLSVNLTLLNILPIPLLDGGQLFILLIEAIKRKTLTMKQRLVIQQLGLAIIVILLVLVLFNDVTRLR